jgi:RNA polymerase sigma factor (sigma-70 family)
VARGVVQGVDGESRLRGVVQLDPANGFAEFYQREFPVAARLAHLLSGRDEVAEDLAQLAMVRVHSHFGQLDNPAAYLRTTLVNVCRNWHRSIARERGGLQRAAAQPQVLSPEVQHVLDVVDSLPYRQRAVIVLRYWLDLSEVEIADHLACRPGTVKSLASRAIERLRKELQSER